jgi:hypothetical protein
MSALSVIEKVLADIGKGIEIFEGIEPIVYPVLPQGAQGTATQVTDDLASIGKAVTDATAVTAAIVPGATAASISQAAIPLVNQVLATSELISGKTITNSAAYATAVEQLTNAIIGLLSAVTKKS